MKKTFYALVGWQGNCGIPDTLRVFRSLPKAEHALRVREQIVRRLRYSGRIETPQGIRYSNRKDCNSRIFKVSCDIQDDAREAFVVVFIVHDEIKVEIKSTRRRAERRLDKLIDDYEFDQIELGVLNSQWDDMSRCYVARVNFNELDEEITDSDTDVSTLRSRGSSRSSSRTLSVGSISD